jgi:hypothetical protein
MVKEYCAAGRQYLTEYKVTAALYEPPVAATCVVQSLRRDHEVSSGQLSVVILTSTFIPVHGVGADVGVDVVGGCGREGGMEVCVRERIHMYTVRLNMAIFNKILTPV